MNIKQILIAGIAGLGILSTVNGQTSGTLNFSCTTSAPSGSWGNKHVLAIWIQNNAAPSVFVKTKAKYGSDVDHLTSWTAISGKNLVDAYTGATLQSYGTISSAWDGTDVSKNVVMDGDYTIYIEMGWGKDKINQHAVASYSFTKGAVAQHITPGGNSNYSNIVIDWQPTATLLNTVEDEDGICIYPNPVDGIVHIKFQKKLSNVSISVFNTAGKLVRRESAEMQEAGTKSLDLRNYSTGLYLISIQSREGNFNYRVVIRK
jgi:flagellar hook assembly protein FlgD